MTDFEPIKEQIWNAVKKDNRHQFDNKCNALITKAIGDWWRIGWNVYPKDINDLLKMIDKLAKKAHKAWIKAMKCGDAPAEDISPGEGFALCSKLIREAIKEKSKK